MIIALSIKAMKIKIILRFCLIQKWKDKQKKKYWRGSDEKERIIGGLQADPECKHQGWNSNIYNLVVTKGYLICL